MSPSCIVSDIIVVVACVAHLINAELFTAVVELQKSLHAEKEAAIHLKNYIKSEEERLEKLRLIANDYQHHADMALDNTEFYLANPVNAFLLVKRFTLEWKKLEELINNHSNTDVMSRLQYLRQNFPDVEDLNGVAAALLRLQDTYKLDTAEIASGDLVGTGSSQLSAGDCFQLGRIAYEETDYYHTILWMEESLKRLNRESNKTAEKTDILDYLAFSMFKQGNTRHALALTNELLELVPDHERAMNNKDYYLTAIEREDKFRPEDLLDGLPTLQNQPKVDPYRTSEEFLTYEALCRDENTHDYKDKHKLRCRYVTNNHPLLLLSPVKEEEAYLKPWIVIYHDLMSDYEINAIKRFATPKLNRATVHNAKTGQLETAFYRVSKSAWLKGTDDPLFHRINKRIEAVSNINQDTSEDLQVVNYGIGGHYEPHYDFARKEEKHAFPEAQANRIATLLYYMTDVEAGGATVFPYIGVKLFPEKGAAAYWYNLYRNGEGIYDTRHAACPVLAGSKWVCNKWMHERGQEFVRPCSLRPDE